MKGYQYLFFKPDLKIKKLLKIKIKKIDYDPLKEWINYTNLLPVICTVAKQ